MKEIQHKLNAAVSDALKNLTNFTGRTPRATFWWWVLFEFLVIVVLDIIAGILDAVTGLRLFGHLARLLQFIVFIVPNLSIGFRRLHDTDRTAWWLLISLIPIAGDLVLIYFYIQRGTLGPNKFGPEPAPLL